MNLNRNADIADVVICVLVLLVLCGFVTGTIS